MILEQLKKQEQFSDTEKDIAVFILKRGEEVVHMTVRELSDACYTSPTAVMRLCAKLGCDGFRDFKVKLLKELENTEEETDFNRPFYIGWSTQKISKTIYDLNRQAMKEALNTIDCASLEKAAKIIANARMTFLYGHGDSSIRARNLMNRLFKINKLCILASESHEEAGLSNNATEKDTGIFISYRGGNSTFVTCAKILKKKKCPVIVLSADVKTELTELADVHLTIPDLEHSGDNIGTFYSQAAFDYLLNVLYSLVYSRTYTESHRHKKQIDEYTLLK